MKNEDVKMSQFASKNSGYLYYNLHQELTKVLKLKYKKNIKNRLKEKNAKKMRRKQRLR